MRTLWYILICLCITTITFGQDLSSNLYGMTAEQNAVWLKNAVLSEKEQQLELIQNRFFKQTDFKKSENDDIPLIILNGIVVNEIKNAKLKEFLAFQVTTDQIEILIMDKEPEKLYVNKSWTGVVFLTIKDKKLVRKLLRQ